MISHFFISFAGDREGFEEFTWFAIMQIIMCVNQVTVNVIEAREFNFGMNTLSAVMWCPFLYLFPKYLQKVKDSVEPDFFISIPCEVSWVANFKGASFSLVTDFVKMSARVLKL